MMMGFCDGLDIALVEHMCNSSIASACNPGTSSMPGHPLASDRAVSSTVASFKYSGPNNLTTVVANLKMASRHVVSDIPKYSSNESAAMP